MRDIALSVLLVAVFILVGGLFAATEIALVSLREGQLRAIGDGSRRGARVARLVKDPNRFLATVQVGVTFTGFLSAAFGEATLAGRLEHVLDDGLPTGLADVLATVVITLIIAYFAIVFGELAPKRVGLQRPERVALVLAPALDRVATVLRPFIWSLSRSTDIVVRLVGGDPSARRDAITEEELRDLVTAHEALSPDERQLIAEVFEAGERQVREVMIPRTEVDFLDAALPLTKATALVAASPHSRFPVFRGTHDSVVGFVHVRDLFGAPGVREPGAKVGDLCRAVTLLPDSRTVLNAMSDLRRVGQHIAVVVDEYGGTAGIVTLEDLIEELVGEIRDEYDPAHDRRATRLSDGDLEVDGLLNLDEFTEATGAELPEGPYETVAGCLLATLGRLPAMGDRVEVAGLRLAVTEMDGRRVARVRVTRLQPAEDGVRNMENPAAAS